MKILAFESSCDETSVSVIDNSVIKSNIISSQLFHKNYGGVVPELASRAHVQWISQLTKDALNESKVNISDLNAIAVTTEPGLICSLIVGSSFAKGISLKYGLPIIPINHIEGHLYSGNLEHEEIQFPFICLVVSGGHTAIFHVKDYNNYDVIGLTRDDAAGEAFDKIAKLLGLPYPGGPEIDKLAKKGDEKKFDFPRPMIHDKHFDFSFSGLKTSVRYFIHKNFGKNVPEEELPNICASVQAAIVDVLVNKTVKAARKYKVKDIVIAGGVSANSKLRKEMKLKANEYEINSYAPNMEYCMDNAAMIAFLADRKLQEKNLDKLYDLTFRVNPSALRAKRK
jgi:N6-L-threonylcarbamoyladenine synthase